MAKKPAKPDFLEESPQPVVTFDDTEPMDPQPVEKDRKHPVTLVPGKKLGKKFGDAVLKAGLAEGISWTPDGEIIGLDSLPQDKRDKLEGLIKAHNPEA